jgi:hypothetical protein
VLPPLFHVSHFLVKQSGSYLQFYVADLLKSTPNRAGGIALEGNRRTGITAGGLSLTIRTRFDVQTRSSNLFLI